MVVSFFSDGWLDLGVELGGVTLNFFRRPLPMSCIQIRVLSIFVEVLGKTTVEPSLSKGRRVFSILFRQLEILFLFFLVLIASNATQDGCQRTTTADRVFSQVSQCKKAAMEGQEATDEDDVVRILILGQKDAMTLWR